MLFLLLRGSSAFVLLDASRIVSFADCLTEALATEAEVVLSAVALTAYDVVEVVSFVADYDTITFAAVDEDVLDSLLNGSKGNRALPMTPGFAVVSDLEESPLVYELTVLDSLIAEEPADGGNVLVLLL